MSRYSSFLLLAGILSVAGPSTRANDALYRIRPAGWIAESPIETALAAGDTKLPIATDSVCPGWYASAEYLLLRLRRRGLDYAIPTRDTADYIGDGTVREVEFTHDSGYRAGLGYITSSGWDIGFRYTAFDTLETASANAPAGGNLWATLSHPAHRAEAGTAFATAGLDYEVFDLELGRWMQLNRFTAVRMLGGLRWLETDQQLVVQYDGAGFREGLVQRTRGDSGLGVRLGGEVHWAVFRGLSTFLRGSAAVVYSQAETVARETDEQGQRLLVDIADDHTQSVSNLEAAMGLAYARGPWTIRGGYELSTWFNLSNQITFDDQHRGAYASISDDLLLEGLFLSLTYRR
jgi:hypothetical protein